MIICDNFSERPVVTLVMNSGVESDYTLLSIFPVWEMRYAALVEKEDQESKNGISFYRVMFDENNNPTFEDLGEDEEFELVADEFLQIAPDQGIKIDRSQLAR